MTPTHSIAPAAVFDTTDTQRKNTMPYLTSAFAVGWRHHLWLALLIAASVGFTLGFACAVPFAAFGAIAALSLPRRDALLLTLALWLVNQVIGFTMLHYPWDGTTLIWGAVLGAVALLCTAAAQVASRGRGIIAGSLTGFLAAFVVYEGSLYIVSAAALGGTEDSTAAIVQRILEINAVAFIGLTILGWIAGRLGFASRVPMSARHA
jgi:hypothetical protein